MSDPYLILGLAPDADDAQVHTAYLAAVKTCPPDRDPRRFESLRTAYESLRTRRDRLAHALFDSTPPTLADCLDKAGPVGPPGRPSREQLLALLKGAA